MNRQQEQLFARIEAFEIDEPGATFTFVERLAKENEWPHEYAQRVVEEYKKFLFLSVAAGHPVTPSHDVDHAWHLHLTYTRSYWDRMCTAVLGRPLHHDPSRGGVDESQKFQQWYVNTIDSYERLFGVQPPFDVWPRSDKRHKLHQKQHDVAATCAAFFGVPANVGSHPGKAHPADPVTGVEMPVADTPATCGADAGAGCSGASCGGGGGCGGGCGGGG
jgi:hypothetical protein